MKIFFDTNVILDILLDRKPFVEDSLASLQKAITKGERIYISSSSLTDIYYLLHKAMQNRETILETIKKLSCILDFASVSEDNVLMAAYSRMSDYEDAVLDQVAQTVDADFILTRNIKDFVYAKTKTMTPSDYLKLA